MRNALLTGFLCLVSSAFGVLALLYESDLRVQSAGLGLLSAVLLVLGCWRDGPRTDPIEDDTDDW